MDAKQRRKLVLSEARDLIDMGTRSGYPTDYTYPQLKAMGVPTVAQYLKKFPKSEWGKRRAVYQETPVEMLTVAPKRKIGAPKSKRGRSAPIKRGRSTPLQKRKYGGQKRKAVGDPEGDSEEKSADKKQKTSGSFGQEGGGVIFGFVTEGDDDRLPEAIQTALDEADVYMRQSIRHRVPGIAGALPPRSAFEPAQGRFAPSGAMKVTLGGKYPVDMVSLGTDGVTYGGDYLRIVKSLGHGSFAKTFEAEILSLGDAKVALKIVDNQVGTLDDSGTKVIQTPSDVYETEKIIREYLFATSIPCLSDPSRGAFVCVHGIIALANPKSRIVRLGMIMEKMEGSIGDFMDKISGGRVSPVDEIYLRLLCVCKAINKMRQLHQLGIFHQDGYSANWMVNWTGREMDPDVRAIDIGLACRMLMGYGDHCFPEAASQAEREAQTGAREYSRFMDMVIVVLREIFESSPLKDAPEIADIEKIWSKLRADVSFGSPQYDTENANFEERLCCTSSKISLLNLISLFLRGRILNSQQKSHLISFLN
jgi:hypothetical protein